MPRNKNSISGQFTSVNKIELVNSGKEYFDLLLLLINNARESIHAQYYIFKDDATGIMIAEALKAAAKRNVQVHLLVDGYASQSLSRSFVHQLKTSGIHFRYFEPLFRSRHFYFGRRMHQKVFVADTRYSLVGGINVADRYNDINGENAWLDFSLYAEGEISKELCILCWKTWNEYPHNMGITPCEQHVIKFSIPEESKAEVRMSRNDWVRRKNEISKTYIDMLLYARSNITILCSYFLPGRHIRKQIRN
ncbi:MAG: phospholipase, partial [Bacteroidetes bacterium]|nr:phospholipase [Bacteroidota bacterium]